MVGNHHQDFSPLHIYAREGKLNLASCLAEGHPVKTESLSLGKDGSPNKGATGPK